MPIEIVTVLLSVILSLIGSLLLTEYRYRRKRSIETSKELEDWYTQSAAFASEVRRIWERLFDKSEAPGGNLSEIQAELGLMEGQISRHASQGEQIGADQAVIDALDDLANECQRVDSRTLHLDSFDAFRDFREDMIETVEQLESTLQSKEA